MSCQPHDRGTEGERGKGGEGRGSGMETDRQTDRQIFINSLSELMTAQVQAI